MIYLFLGVPAAGSGVKQL